MSGPPGASPALKGDVIVVTGAAGGIGRATCRALTSAGAIVVGTDLADEPKELDGPIWIRHDVASIDSWSDVLRQVEARFGQLDGLVNNAGLAHVAPLADTSIEAWRKVFSVNVEGVLLGMQVALPLLRKSGAKREGGASVVNVSSTAGLRGVPFNAAYSASKGAVTLLTKSAAKEFGVLGFPIRVNSVHPGSVDTAMSDAILERYVEVGLASSVNAARASANAARPLRRLGKADEIASAILFLCSSASSFVTGSEMVIDGGATA